MHIGEEADLIGPLGNAWTDFLPAPEKTSKPIALVGGGIGIAPLNALLNEDTGHRYIMHAGFKEAFSNEKEQNAFLGPAVFEAEKIILACEDGAMGLKGRIPDFLEPEQYAAVCACGPDPMLQAVAEKCKAAAVPCYVSLERRMACGVGACLGCTVATINDNRGVHNRRCCADGPIFNAQELIFDG